MSTSSSNQDSLLRQAPPATRPLRIGVLSYAGGLPAWMDSALATLIQTNEIAAEDVFLLPDRRKSPRSAPPFPFRRFQDSVQPGPGELLALSNSLLQSRRPIELQTRSGEGLAPEDRALIAERRLDLLLCASAPSLSGDCAKLARLGVWSMVLGEPEFTGYSPPYWREVYEERNVSRGFLLVHSECFERGRILESFALATTPSLRFTINQPVISKAAAAALQRGLTRAAARETLPDSGEEIELGATPARWPSSLETLNFVCRKLARSVKLRVEGRNKSTRWLVGVRPVSGRANLWNLREGAPFVEVEAPPGHYYADPFVVEHEARHWLFVEDWIDSRNRAVLTCLELRDDGSTGEPVVVLDKPYHLSYPHVFSQGGDFFMIPETFEDSTVQLYRATRFPHDWTLETVLLPNTQCVDTTAFPYDGKWYFFTSTQAEPEEALLYTADRLGGPLKAHPANPIGTDVRGLRSAGAVVPWRNTLIRPTQDCSLGYGYAVTFNEILRLSPAEYQERQTGKLLPDWAPGLTGTHTLNFNSKFEVVDGRRLMRKQDA